MLTLSFHASDSLAASLRDHRQTTPTEARALKHGRDLVAHARGSHRRESSAHDRNRRNTLVDGCRRRFLGLKGAASCATRKVKSWLQRVKR